MWQLGQLPQLIGDLLVGSMIVKTQARLIKCLPMVFTFLTMLLIVLC